MHSTRIKIETRKNVFEKNDKSLLIKFTFVLLQARRFSVNFLLLAIPQSSLQERYRHYMQLVHEGLIQINR